MPTITITVPDNISQFELDKLHRYAGMLVDPNWIASFWSTEDVQAVAPKLSDVQAREVLKRVDRNHDANIGINWDTISFHCEDLFPGSTSEDEDEEE